MQAFLAETTMIANTPRLGLAAQEGIVEQVKRRMKESPFTAVRRLRCDFHEGVLTLRGQVPTYYTKQIAISLARNSPDVVVDRLEVVQPTLPTS